MPERDRVRVGKLGAHLRELIKTEMNGTKRSLGANAINPLHGIKLTSEEHAVTSKPSIRSTAASVSEFIRFAESLSEEDISVYYKHELSERVDELQAILSVAHGERETVFNLDLHRQWQETYAPFFMRSVRETLKYLNEINQICTIQEFTSRSLHPEVARFQIDTARLTGVIAEFHGLLRAESQDSSRNSGPYWEQPFLGIKFAA